MHDTVGILDWLLNAGQHYPDLLCLTVAAIAGMAVTIAVDWYFLCDTAGHPAWVRMQKAGTFLGCWMGSSVVAVVWWTLLDPADPLPLRSVVSFTVEAIPAFGYPFLATYLTHKVPSIASAWALKP